MQKDGEFSAASECDSSLVELVNLDQQCYVSFVQLRASPFNLEFLDTVQAKFNAYNVIGESEYSQVNVEGSFVEVEPT